MSLTISHTVCGNSMTCHVQHLFLISFSLHATKHAVLYLPTTIHNSLCILLSVAVGIQIKVMKIIILIMRIIIALECYD